MALRRQPWPRMQLARVLYGCAELVLLDDPLSAVDAHVGRALFDGVLIRALACAASSAPSPHLPTG
jgi:ABC-type protease/lipase transport system fused ATPase/permease subunit